MVLHLHPVVYKTTALLVKLHRQNKLVRAQRFEL